MPVVGRGVSRGRTQRKCLFQSSRGRSARGKEQVSPQGSPALNASQHAPDIPIGIQHPGLRPPSYPNTELVGPTAVVARSIFGNRAISAHH